jgi:fused signal recognition particle receptor
MVAERTSAIQPEPEAASPAEAPAKSGWFSRLKAGLTKTSSRLSDGITSLFTKRKLDAATLEDLEDLLIQSDLGVETAMRITTALSAGRYEKGIGADDVRTVLASEVERVLTPVAKPLLIDSGRKPHVVLVVGVNGTGKTTTIGKLAQQYRRDGKTVMMAAGDTFRAAAIEQLGIWAERTGAAIISRKVGSDASGLAFDALKDAQIGGYDVLLVDTAGRLQNKQALMEELEKVIRVIKKVDPTAPHDVVLVLDATTGQNALSQVDVFRQRAGVTGLVMTKLDGTARGGILVAIAAKFGLPIHAIGVGEGVDDLQPFNPGEFARAIAVS